MRLGYIKDENGNLTRKWVKEGEDEKNPEVLFPVVAQFGDYIWTDEEHMQAAKATLLEDMIYTIRELAKNGKFWIVKGLSDFESEENPLFAMEHEIPQQAKDGKSLVAWKLHLPQMEGCYPKEVADQIQKELEACCGRKPTMVLELGDTVGMMVSADYKERFKAEYHQTKIRYEKLYQMCAKYEAGTLDFETTCSLDLLNDQLVAMSKYLQCLEVRSQIEGIEL